MIVALVNSAMENPVRRPGSSTAARARVSSADARKVIVHASARYTRAPASKARTTFEYPAIDGALINTMSAAIPSGPGRPARDLHRALRAGPRCRPRVLPTRHATSRVTGPLVVRREEFDADSLVVHALTALPGFDR
jgi:hypothetical protein